MEAQRGCRTCTWSPSHSGTRHPRPVLALNSVPGQVPPEGPVSPLKVQQTLCSPSGQNGSKWPPRLVQTCLRPHRLPPSGVEGPARATSPPRGTQLTSQTGSAYFPGTSHALGWLLLAGGDWRHQERSQVGTARPLPTRSVGHTGSSGSCLLGSWPVAQGFEVAACRCAAPKSTENSAGGREEQGRLTRRGEGSWHRHGSQRPDRSTCPRAGRMSGRRWAHRAVPSQRQAEP
jgi:hypothetical protein